jgi:hypothetical protein
MGVRFLTLVTLCLIALLLVPFGAEATEGDTRQEEVLVDRVLVVVGNSPITASQVNFENEVRGQIALSSQREQFGRLLNESVDALEALIFREILRRLPDARTIQIKDTDARNRLRLFESTFDDISAASSFRARWGMSRAELLEFFKESVILDEVVEVSVLISVTEEEKRDYYDRNRNRVFGDKPYLDVAEFVSQQVYLLKFDAAYNSWKSKLRAGASKRYIGR